ncbi:2865_t:CDS:2 [Gigaspora margarita]|uniref:2865_t:CDS:1 n=1 Tax=Gigaspora margarita TaxID=4874 RepID=A0ABN7UN43_GIGMA|nr:2865_t:CDS:2 [Gigaspora margarita]
MLSKPEICDPIIAKDEGSYNSVNYFNLDETGLEKLYIRSHCIMI